MCICDRCVLILEMNRYFVFFLSLGRYVQTRVIVPLTELTIFELWTIFLQLVTWKCTHLFYLITLFSCFHPNLSRTIWCRPTELHEEQTIEVAKAANTQQRYRYWWQIITGSHSHQDERCCGEAEPDLPSERFGTAQTSGLHRDGPNLRPRWKEQGRGGSDIFTSDDDAVILKKSHWMEIII